MIIPSEVLHDKISALQLSYGRGKILLYGFKPQQRAQAHGTYRYLFNALYSYDEPAIATDAPTAAPPQASQPAAGSAATTSGATQPVAAQNGRRRAGATP